MNDLNVMENQEVIALIAIDLSAAFEAVDHEILLDVLEVSMASVVRQWNGRIPTFARAAV